MDKLSAADINTHMAGCGAGVVGAEEEHQIAGLQLTHGYCIAIVQLRSGAMRETDAKVGEDKHGKSGAVKAAGAGAAIDIRRTQILLGKSGNVTAGTAGHSPAAFACAACCGSAGLGLFHRGLGLRRFLLHGQIQIVTGDVAGLITALDGKPAVFKAGDLHTVAILQGSQYLTVTVGFLQQRHFLGIHNTIGLEGFAALEQFHILRRNKAGAVVIADTEPVVQILHHRNESIQREQDVNIALLGGVKVKGNILFRDLAHSLDLCVAGQQAGKLRLLSLCLKTGGQGVFQNQRLLCWENDRVGIAGGRPGAYGGIA